MLDSCSVVTASDWNDDYVDDFCNAICYEQDSDEQENNLDELRLHIFGDMTSEEAHGNSSEPDQFEAMPELEEVNNAACKQPLF